ncbi:zinc dependent phospholipase C family protein [Blautia sp.]|uniref:zinc dependent phospholipase C family protein n=1 Tax=Blautia sp. TaxID=1955243 RepID=UPI003AB361A2
MPTTYTHDLFGKIVYKQLPEEIRKVIRKNGDLFRIGLHGPDILFYDLTNLSVSSIGVEMHSIPAASFFLRGMSMVRARDDERLLAYLLGFGCHYLLDSVCHPHVEDVAKAKVITHTLLEKEFDRTLMLETNKNPYHFYPSDCIVPKVSYARVIRKMFPGLGTRDILVSLRMMKFLTNAMVYDNRGKRRFLVALVTRIAGKRKSRSALEFFMEKDPVPGSEKPVKELHRYFDQAAEEAPAYIEELYSLSKEELPLSKRWNRTYNG